MQIQTTVMIPEAEEHKIKATLEETCRDYENQHNVCQVGND